MHDLRTEVTDRMPGARGRYPSDSLEAGAMIHDFARRGVDFSVVVQFEICLLVQFEIQALNH